MMRLCHNVNGFESVTSKSVLSLPSAVAVIIIIIYCMVGYLKHNISLRMMIPDLPVQPISLNCVSLILIACIYHRKLI